MHKTSEVKKGEVRIGKGLYKPGSLNDIVWHAHGMDYFLEELDEIPTFTRDDSWKSTEGKFTEEFVTPASVIYLKDRLDNHYIIVKLGEEYNLYPYEKIP